MTAISTARLRAATNDAWHGMGTVFKVTTNGTLTTLVSFNHTNGANPHAALTLGNDGNFYGTTAYGGSSNGYRDGVQSDDQWHVDHAGFLQRHQWSVSVGGADAGQ